MAYKVYIAVEPKLNSATVTSFPYRVLKSKGTGREKTAWKVKEGKHAHISLHVSDGGTGRSYSQHMLGIAILWHSKLHRGLH